MMGKSRDKSGKRTRINEEEERRKMRESILKIFHERAQSPEGAVLVSDSVAVVDTSSLPSMARSWKEAKSQQYGDGSAEAISLSSGSPIASQPVMRKRKRRHKVMTGQESVSNSNKRTVSQHVKSAHSHLNKESQDRSRNMNCQKQDIGGHITRNRLTRRIGLFNPGKKSRTIYRDPPPVPESVQKDVEKTLKHILTKDDEDDNWSSHPYDATVTSATITSAAGRTNAHSRSSTLTPGSATVGQGSKGKPPSAKSLGSSSGKPRTAGRQISGESPVQLDVLFPKIAPYKEIAGSMLTYLEAESKQNFGDRDLLTVTCKDLQKLLGQNQRTPEAICSGVQTSEGGSSARQTIFNSCHISSDTSSADVGHHPSHNMDIPVHSGYPSATHTGHVTHTFSGPSSLTSVHTLRPDLQTSAMNLETALQSEQNQPVFSFSQETEPQLTFTSRFERSDRARHELIWGVSDENSYRTDPHVLETSSTYGQLLSYAHEGKRTEPGENNEIPGDVNTESKECMLRKEERRDCDMRSHLGFKSESQGLVQNDSAIRLLQCNNFISRVSSICGEADISSQETFSPVTLTRHPESLSSASCNRQRKGHPVQDLRDFSDRDGSHRNREPDTFLKTLMARSSTVQSCCEGQLEPTYNQQHQQAKASDTFSGADYYRSQWNVSDIALGVPDRRSSDNPYYCNERIVTNTRVHGFQRNASEREVSFSSRHDHQADVLDQLDVFPHLSSQDQFWHQHHLPYHHGAGDGFPQDQEYSFTWDQSDDILPPLRKPSLNSPSPPQKMSPHKWC